MTQTLEDILLAGRAAINAENRKAEAKAADLEAKRLELESKKLASAKELVPYALRDFVSLKGSDHDEALVIVLPGGATVQHLINVITSGPYNAQVFERVELAENRKGISANSWNAYRWLATDEGVDYWSTGVCPTLETALALAVEMYADKEEVEKSYQRVKQAQEEKQAKASQRTSYCPLLRDDCQRKSCAWWMSLSEMCAILSSSIKF